MTSRRYGRAQSRNIFYSSFFIEFCLPKNIVLVLRQTLEGTNPRETNPRETNPREAGPQRGQTLECDKPQRGQRLERTNPRVRQTLERDKGQRATNPREAGPQRGQTLEGTNPREDKPQSATFHYKTLEDFFLQYLLQSRLCPSILACVHSRLCPLQGSSPLVFTWYH